MKKVVAITACPSGVAHTYMAAECLRISGEKEGVDIRVETQGGAGVENPLDPQDIEEAVCAIVANDIEIIGMERLRGKKVLRLPVADIIKQSDDLLHTIAKTF